MSGRQCSFFGIGDAFILQEKIEPVGGDDAVVVAPYRSLLAMKSHGHKNKDDDK